MDNGAAPSSAAAPNLAPVVPGDPLSLVLEEKLLVVLHKDGSVDKMEVQGTIALQVRAASLTLLVHHCIIPSGSQRHLVSRQSCLPSSILLW